MKLIYETEDKIIDEKKTLTKYKQKTLLRILKTTTIRLSLSRGINYINGKKVKHIATWPM